MVEWLKKSAGAEYAGGVSTRLFSDWLGSGELRFVKVGGTILTRTDWIDEFLEKHEAQAGRIDDIANEILKELK